VTGLASFKWGEERGIESQDVITSGGRYEFWREAENKIKRKIKKKGESLLVK
jgi:hypothetical protein